MEEKKSYPITRLVNWYFGNYCTRKCFDNDERLKDHYEKLQLFAQKNPKLEITHREFLQLFNDHMTLCSLDEGFKRKAIGWTLFTILTETPNYDSDKIIVQGKLLRRKDGLLEKRVRCKACESLGIPP